jgi:hypothetical protein
MVAFWDAYDDKGRERSSRAKVFDQWTAIRPDAAMVADIMAGLDAWNRSESWRNGYALGAHRFLKERKWTERPAAPRTVPSFNGATRAPSSGVVSRGDGDRQRQLIGR